MGDKWFYLVIVLITGTVLGSILFLSAKDAPGNPSEHIYGKADSVISLVEYGDFQCPACFRYFPVLKEVKEKYKDQISFQFRNFPIARAHPNAMEAHRSAEAASRQDMFWEMHDLLYENQQEWAQSTSPTEFFESYAKQLSLNIDQFRLDVKDEALVGVINADLEEGRVAGASGTPSFVLNGEKIENPSPTLEAFSELIDKKLAE